MGVNYPNQPQDKGVGIWPNLTYWVAECSVEQVAAAYRHPPPVWAFAQVAQEGSRELGKLSAPKSRNRSR